jgi:hypothetical protein
MPSSQRRMLKVASKINSSTPRLQVQLQAQVLDRSRLSQMVAYSTFKN